MSTSLDVVKEQLAPLRPLLENAHISEIEVNPPSTVFYELDGVRYRSDVELDPELLEGAVTRIAHSVGEEVKDRNGSLRSPRLNCRFADGARISARMAVLFPPHSVGGISLTLRKFNVAHLTVDDFVELEMLTADQADFLIKQIVLRRNILISGSTGTGKTTLLNALAAFIPAEERIVCIENPSELWLTQANVLRWEARGRHTQAHLLEDALRHGPDRIILGEFRGAEALALLLLLNTGHAGCISTTHSNSARDALTRFLLCVEMARHAPPEESIKRMIGSNVEVVVHLEKDRTGKRYVKEVVSVKAFDDCREV